MTAAAAATGVIRRKSKHMRAAADLRAKLKQAVQLQSSSSRTAASSAEAEQIFAGLRAAAAAPSIHTAYKNSQRLREVALGFGGYAKCDGQARH